MNKALTAACATALFATLLTASASNASAHAPCGAKANDIDGSSYPTATFDAVNIRTGSSTGCTSVGLLLKGQKVDYYCYTIQHTGDNYSWTYLRDVPTGKIGWVRSDLLPDYGSHINCGF